MGNSGSVHHTQSGLKELHSYYQVQTNGDGPPERMSFMDEGPQSFHKDQKCLEHEKSLPRSKFSRIPSNNRINDHLKCNDAAAKNSQVKVLPHLNENLRLRSTTNGAILQSGGTISGRKESLLPQPVALERSRTFIAEHSGETLKDISAARFLNRRSQTQLNIELRKVSIPSPVSGNQLQTNSTHYKRYTSNLDLKVTDELLEAETNASETYQKLSKVKIKNKKRKAPPVPPISSTGTKANELLRDSRHANQVHNETERKQRLFKTKSETTLQASTSSLQLKPLPAIPSRNSKLSLKPTGPATNVPIANVRSSYRPKNIRRNVPATEGPVFRREKSFDATLLSSRQNDYSHSDASKISTEIKRKSLQLPAAPQLSVKTDFKTERSDFKLELEAATKCRLITKNTRESSTRQRDPKNIETKIATLPAPIRISKTETQSKIPQLKRTFYFGMEGVKRIQTESSHNLKPNVLEAKQDDKTCKDEVSSTTSSIKDSDTVYSLNHKDSSEINDNGIQVSVRPMLPRRQLEIPRFSPIAAWRTLSEEYRRQSMEPLASSLSSNCAAEATNTALIEDKIYRTYREPFPFCPDNKSGDSGISGDDGCPPEKPIMPRNLAHMQNECDDIANLDGYPVDNLSQPIKVVGPFLTPWTPQQDLEEEEDTSSDGDLAIKIAESQGPTSAHVFSLSLPREIQLSVYGEKSKPDFRSLQKLKRSISGDLSGTGGDGTESGDVSLLDNPCLSNYRSDNWVLSKTGLSPKSKQSVVRSNHADSSKKSSFLDLSASIQPTSLGFLATGKHVMYLPNKPIREVKRQSTIVPPRVDVSAEEPLSINAHTRNKRFSFQSSVRQIERRRLAERLSKDAEEKEALRKSELEAMRRVEEEFQRKRAYEKASIRQQLRLYSMDDDNFASLPLDFSQNCNGFRDEPDGAVSSTSASPVLRANDLGEDEAYLVRRRNPENENSFNNEYRSSYKLGNDAAIFANS